MELIIKPTAKCNFACTFCSAFGLDILDSPRVPPVLAKQIQLLKPNRVIVTGGDPLCMPSSYYDELLALGDFKVSLTTNLKAFILDPAKWTPILANKRVGVATSFQYGDGRQYAPGVPYGEQMFRLVMAEFKDRIGYVPSFISVISEDNAERALDHLRLAKDLGTKCKLNGCLDLGKSKSTFPFYRMVDIWLEAQKQCLLPWCSLGIQTEHGGCCFNTNLLCASTIRSVWVKRDGSLQYGHCEDCAVAGHTIPVDETRPCPCQQALTKFRTKQCQCCELCRLCNACESRNIASRNDPHFCQEMMKRKEAILNAGWTI